MVEIFSKYLREKWDSESCSVKEKELIQDAIAQILLKYYGDNVFTNRNVSDDSDCIVWFEHIINTELNENKPAVKRYKEEAR